MVKIDRKASSKLPASVLPHLPHHQPSHDEGVEDCEETINRRRVKTERKREKKDLGQMTNLELKHLFEPKCVFCPLNETVMNRRTAA